MLAINADASAPGAPPLATFAIEGTAGTYKFNLQGDAGNAGDRTMLKTWQTFSAENISCPMDTL